MKERSRKISSISMIFVLVLQLFSPMLNAAGFEPASSGEDECLTYEFNASKTSVSAGTDIQFSFEYESKSPACDPEDLTGNSYTFDFSGLIDSDSDITVDAEDEVFEYSISDGEVTLTFKDLSKDHETLTGFGGNASFTVHVKDSLDGNVTIENSVGDDIVINVSGVDVANTNKVSSTDYVVVGDEVEYQILINGDKNYVENFHGVDKAGEGLEYVPGSFWAEEDKTWVNADDLFTASINDEGHLVVENTEPFDSSYLLHYSMKVTSQELSYHNQFDATYDTTTETAGDDVEFDMGSGSWITYDHGNITIEKTDEDGNSLAGAEFDIIDSDGTVEDHLVTDEDGKATSIDLEFGDFTVTETKAPEGYVLDDTEYTVTVDGDGSEAVEVVLPVVNENIKGKLDLNKVDEEGNPLAGAEFTIYDSEGNVVETIVTDEDGYAISGDLEYGDYTVVETDAPDGYILNDTVYDVSITDNEATVHVNDGDGIVNEKGADIDITLPTVDFQGQIDLNKVDEEGNPLAGAEFTIYDSEGTEVETIVTDEDGYAISSLLDLGDYTVVETNAPTGYILDDTVYNVTIGSRFEVVHVNDGAGIVNEKGADIDVTLPPIDVQGQIDLNKVDEEGNPLAGAEFTIYDSEGNEVETIVTDEEGYAISSLLDLGDYTVVETNAPTGYILDDTVYNVTIGSRFEIAHVNDGAGIVNEKGADIDVTLPPIDVQGQIDLNKVDEEGNPLAGAEFTIYDSEGNEVETIVTDEEGYAISSLLDLGDYTVVETNAPTGYILDDTVYNVTIGSRFEVAHVNDGAGIVNEKGADIDVTLPPIDIQGQIDLNKVDEDGNPLAGAEFTIYDSEGNEVETIVTDEEGYAISSLLDLGDYTVVETKAPVGYVLDDTEYSVTIGSRFEVAHVNDGAGIVNEKGQDIDVTLPTIDVQGQIDLNKVDEEGNPLAGAEFTIYDSEGNVVEVLTTDKDGYAISSLLDLGDYTVVETNAPTGYVLDDTEYNVTIGSRFEVAHVNDGAGIVNVKEDEETVTESEVESETTTETKDELAHTGSSTASLIVALFGVGALIVGTKKFYLE